MRADRDHADLLELEERAYVELAEGAPERFFAALAAYLGGTAAGLSINDLHDGGTSLCWHGLPADVATAYATHYWREDPWRRANLVAPVGVFLSSDRLLPRRELERSAFGHDFLRRSRVEDFHEVVLRRDAHQSIVLGGLYEHRVRGPRRARAGRALLRLGSHVRRAWAIGERAARRQADAEARAALTRAAAVGLAWLDGAGRVLDADPLAAGLLGPMATPALAAAAREVADGAPRALARWRSASGDRDGLAVVTPAPRRPGHVAYVLDPRAAGREAPVELLAAAFGLSPAEARLTAALATGLPLAEAAAELGIAPGTARVQLAAVFRKVGVCRQADLLALVARLGWVA